MIKIRQEGGAKIPPKKGLKREGGRGGGVDRVPEGAGESTCEKRLKVLFCDVKTSEKKNLAKLKAGHNGPHTPYMKLETLWMVYPFDFHH